MKKFLAILVLGLLLISSPTNAGDIGLGELKLQSNVVDWFIKYLKGGYGKKPLVFLVTTDGRHSYYWYCPAATCTPGNHEKEIKICEQKTDKECKVFAKGRTIKWINEINRGGKQGKINSKWSDSEIKAKLTKLGFLGKTTSTTTKVEKKKETGETKTTSASLSEELKELNKLYEDGALTKEEF